MKKYLILILAVFIVLGGCTEKTKNVSDEVYKNKEVNKDVEKPIQKDKNDQDEKKLSEEDEEKIMMHYNEILANKKPYEVLAFIDKNIYVLSEKNADELLIGLEKVQNKYKSEYTDSLLEDDFIKQNKLHKIFGYKFNKRKIEAIEDEDLKALVVEMVKGGYKLVTLEGSFYPIIDYGYLKKYMPYVSDEMKGFINIVSRESNHLTWNGDKVSISWDELSNRALKAEEYLKKYKESQMRKEVANLYMMYINTLMNGSQNMPLLDVKTNKVNNKILNSYQKLLTENATTTTAKIIKEYIEAIEKNEAKIDDTIIEVSDKLRQKVIEDLNLGKGLTDYTAQ
ncbi:hypothetical protein [Crassaminicella indica]|uniref:Lipoprotein n=1 Tax=Crassaminicella indica TaxID=2855394 RepID=A0ABX8RCY9_9CLOT|nr:hypothetical protein [Crassaminicella indica]QXM06927.1 hypothetical protein KVH43_04190 [Crassaminicella indica]